MTTTPPTDDELREILALRRERDEWRFLHEQFAAAQNTRAEIAEAENATLRSQLDEAINNWDQERQMNAALFVDCEDLRTQLAEYETLFDLQHKRDMEAVRRWREENPKGRSLTLPDRGNLLDWLWTQLAAAEAVVEAARLPCDCNHVNSHWADCDLRHAVAAFDADREGDAE